MVGPTILNEEQKAKLITQLTTQTLLTPVLRNRIVMRAADSRLVLQDVPVFDEAASLLPAAFMRCVLNYLSAPAIPPHPHAKVPVPR